MQGDPSPPREGGRRAPLKRLLPGWKSSRPSQCLWHAVLCALPHPLLLPLCHTPPLAISHSSEEVCLTNRGLRRRLRAAMSYLSSLGGHCTCLCALLGALLKAPLMALGLFILILPPLQPEQQERWNGSRTGASPGPATAWPSGPWPHPPLASIGWSRRSLSHGQGGEAWLSRLWLVGSVSVALS